MNAEIVAIGDELTSGQRADTNGQWLSQRLAELGIRPLFHTTVGDDLAANIEVFRQAIQRVDVLVATGGLGPTADDLTREALARATARALVLDEAALTHIRALFARRKREMPPRNVVQAMFPQGSRVISNPHGTAPGIDLSVDREGRGPCRVFALPGVPAEMREMWQQGVAPALARLQGDKRRVIRHRSIKCFGVGESELERMLPDLIRRGRVPSVGITAHKATLSLRITAEADSEEDCHALMAPTVETIYESLGHLVFGEGDECELEHAVVALLRQRGETLATAEIGSGGMLAAWLSGADDDRRAFAGGWVIRPAGPEQLAVEPISSGRGGSHVADVQPGLSCEALFERRFTRYGTWREVVATYAQAVRTAFGATYGLAVGAFPQSDSADQPPGDVHLGMAAPSGTQTRVFPFAGHPDLVKTRAVKQSLDALRLTLLGL